MLCFKPGLPGTHRFGNHRIAFPVVASTRVVPFPSDVLAGEVGAKLGVKGMHRLFDRYV